MTQIDKQTRNYIAYGRKLGWKMLPGHEFEFAAAAEKIFSLKMDMKSAVFKGTDEDVAHVRSQLEAAEKMIAEHSSRNIYQT